MIRKWHLEVPPKRGIWKLNLEGRWTQRLDSIKIHNKTKLSVNKTKLLEQNKTLFIIYQKLNRTNCIICIVCIQYICLFLGDILFLLIFYYFLYIVYNKIICIKRGSEMDQKNVVGIYINFHFITLSSTGYLEYIIQYKIIYITEHIICIIQMGNFCFVFYIGGIILQYN